jgi:hypothetical protein
MDERISYLSQLMTLTSYLYYGKEALGMPSPYILLLLDISWYKFKNVNSF